MGLLFVALLTILKIGSRLKAPVNLSGQWHISSNSVEPTDSRCSSFLYLNNSDATILQSGVYLTLLAGNQTKFRGKIDNLSLSLSEDDNNGKCNSMIKASLNQGDNLRDEMKGILYNPKCKGCPEVSFSAKRYH